MMNLFQPSVKLVSKTRIGSRIVRRYNQPQTLLDRLKASGQADPEKLAALLTLREKTDPLQTLSNHRTRSPANLQACQIHPVGTLIDDHYTTDQCSVLPSPPRGRWKNQPGAPTNLLLG